jgi:hypothetical protein
MGPDSAQSEAFEHTAAPLLKKFLSGDSCLLFAYGMTNSGKTYTMQGTNIHPGILPRLVSAIQENMDPCSKYELSISMLEIYQDKIYDLLGKRKEKLSIRDGNGKVEVAKLSSHPIESTADAFRLMDLAATNR